MTTAGLYVHIPFCRARCAYCDFCSFTNREDSHARYIEALLAEATAVWPAWQAVEFDTLYIGGGTPTTLPTDLLVRLLRSLLSRMAPAPREVTIEANPGTIDIESLRALRSAGLNRLSLGVQSMNDDELGMMGRIHNASAAAGAVRMARQAGIENISLDLIYGLPGQTLHSWQHSLEATLALEPTHLSMYALTLDEQVPMAQRIASGQLPAPDEDLAADMYEWARECLGRAGYAQYEISNWALATPGDSGGSTPLLASRHNLHYWRNERYMGLGVAAFGFDGRRRQGNATDLDLYMQNALAGRSCVATSERLLPAQHMDETVMLALRLVEGVSRADFYQRFGQELEEVYAEAIAESVEEELLEQDARGIRLTPRGLLLGNRVFARFLRD